MKLNREIILIFGKTGSGKTTLAKSLMLKYKRLFIFDTLIEYENGLIFYTFEDLLNFILDNNINQDSEFTFVLRFTNDLDFDYAFRLIYELGNICIILEEAESYISPYQKKSDFLKLVRYGRHKEISIIGIARRTAELSLDFRSQTDIIYSLKQTNVKDIKNMESLGFIGLQDLHEYKYPGKLIENTHYIKIEY